MNRRLLQYTILAILFVNLLSTSYVLVISDRAIRAATAHATASEDGDVSLCINQPPTINITCNATMSQGTLYTCQLQGFDAEGGGVTFFQNATETPIFNVSSTGLINFTPTNNDTGNHSTILGVRDESGCANDNATGVFNFTVDNINDAPYLVQDIPDQNLSANTTLVAFFLNDYFLDPDGDNLDFTYLQGLSEVTVNITLANDSSVTFTGSLCGIAYFQFTASDPYNLSATSNLVRVNITCPPPASTPSSSGGSSSGGGGGGGGGSFFTCKPEMVCLPWSECYVNGMQRQVCKDKNGCSDEEVVFDRNCTYADEAPSCTENWLCSEWSVCSAAGLQNRTCEDLGSCQTAFLRPPLEQGCVYNPRCDDGVMNGDETGVDCGGGCGPCSEIQRPEPLFPGSRTALVLSLLFGLLILVLVSLLILYREKLQEGLAEIGWLLARPRQKEILLTPAEKSELLATLAALDSELPRLAPTFGAERLDIVGRTYFSYALDIPLEYSSEELRVALRERKLPSDLETALAGLAQHLGLLEAKGRLHAGRALDLLLEELRLLVCMTSDYELAEIERELPSRKITPELSFDEEIRFRLLNAYEALEFRRDQLAKEEYLRLLRVYDSLPETAKPVLYEMINSLYSEILYVEETSRD